MYAIEFQDFSCFYQSKKDYVQALSHLDLAIVPGEFFAVVGASGSGKSTLIKACLGMADAFQGELLIDSVTIEELDLKSGKYACVRQEIALYPNMTVYENIASPLRIMKTPQAEVDRRVKEIADLLDVRLMLTRKPRQLSGGQQQRIAIARALIKNPSFLYFDEPFSNVDPSLREDLRKLVKKIHRQLQPTVIFVTHDLEEAFGLADRIAVLEEGRVVEIGTPDELRANGKSELIRTWLEQL